MPKVVDHEQRRGAIIDAVWAIIADRGIAAVTLRAIAERADVSMGQVQHYFASRDQIVRSAAVAIADAQFGRATPQADDPDAALTDLLIPAIPTTAQRQLGAKVWYAYLAEAITNPEIADVVRGVFTHAEREVTAIVGDIDAARALLANTDGLVCRVLVGHLSSAEAQRLLAAQIDSAPKTTRTR